MRPAAALLLSLSGLAAGCTLAACFDLFHATDELRTACEIDAAASGGCLCAASHADARRRAEHACGWLGACETPLGGNAVGTCMVAAVLAFDCEANPSHPVKGKQADTWACLAAATTCGEVDACLFPAGRPQCTARGDYAACATPSGLSAGSGDLRVECTGGDGSPPSVAHGESCALWGKTCALMDDPTPTAVCASSATQECTVDQCADGGTRIDWCVNGTNVGLDCAGWGNRACGGFPAASPAWIACVPESDPAGACTPTLDAGCSGGVAYSCPTGAPERIDCAALLGPAGEQACHPGALDPPFVWTSPCRVDPPACTGDGCDGGVAIGCALGASFSIDCASAGLGACAMRSTDLGANQRAACTLPSR